MPTDIIKKVQIKNAQSGVNESYNVGAEGADVALSQAGNHIAESDVQAAMADIYDKFYNIDTTPTLNSDDLVTSGGVAQAIKDVQAVAVGTSSTAAATAAKVVTTIKGDFELENGADLIVRFTNANTASNITMAVDGTTAKSIYYKGAAIEPTVLKADIPYEFVYDGTNYVLVGSAGGLSGFEMTEDEYDELPITDQRNPEKLFFIEDALEDAYTASGTASGVAYDNGDSGLDAVNVQDAIDEVVEEMEDHYPTVETITITIASNDITQNSNAIGGYIGSASISTQVNALDQNYNYYFVGVNGGAVTDGNFVCVANYYPNNRNVIINVSQKRDFSVNVRFLKVKK